MNINFNKIPKFLKNKFFITGFIFICWLMFFDKHNLIERTSALSTLNENRKVKELFLSAIEEDSQEIHELTSDNERLEKFAREKYHMKKPDEDIYIIKEE